MIFAFKRKPLQKALQYEKKPFLFGLFDSWITNNNKHAGTKPEKP
jgi:hypothetical protein